jgi:predicted phage terminase large subunit-like protein
MKKPHSHPYPHPFIMEKQLQALWKEALRESFSAFLHQSVLTLNPATGFQPNWHLQVMAEYLHAVETGDIRRLIINMPPRYLKSLCISVAWPAWLLAQNPAKRIIVASYASALSIKHSLDCRELLSSPWYRLIYPQTELLHGQNEKHKYMTTQYGFRLATSVGGAVTGEGGDVLIVDDPLNPSQAQSRLFRNLANRWFEQTFSSRLNDKRKGGIVVVMQRLHPNDLSGYLQEKGNWEVLELPAIAEHTRHFFLKQVDYRIHEGECLHAAREDRQMLAQTRHEMGSYAFLAQYQQQPISLIGGLIKAQWLQRYETRNLPETLEITQSWDTAIKAGAQNDPSVCMTIGRAGGKDYILEVVRDWLEYPQLKRLICTQAEKWQPQAILIEDKASGQSLLQDLRHQTRLPVIPCLPVGDKLTRFAAFTPLFEAGYIALPYHASWLQECEQELLSFPEAVHDDQIDSISQYLAWQRRREQRDGMQMRRV